MLDFHWTPDCPDRRPVSIEDLSYLKVANLRWLFYFIRCRHFQTYSPWCNTVGWAGGLHKFNDLGEDDTIESLKLLERDGLVSSEREGEWSLTTEALERHIVQSIWLRTPSRVFTPRANLPLDQYTSLELELLMADNSWNRLSLAQDQSKAREPYTATPGCCKNWFCDRNGRFFSNYLVCLLKSEELFRAGLKAIHHGQIESYYSAILSCLAQGSPLESIDPWKPVPRTTK